MKFPTALGEFRMCEKPKVRVSEKNKTFLDNMIDNRKKLDMDKGVRLSYDDCLGIISKFFKENNPEYKRMLAEEVENEC